MEKAGRRLPVGLDCAYNLRCISSCRVSLRFQPASIACVVSADVVSVCVVSVRVVCVTSAYSLQAAPHRGIRAGSGRRSVLNRQAVHPRQRPAERPESAGPVKQTAPPNLGRRTEWAAQLHQAGPAGPEPERRPAVPAVPPRWRPAEPPRQRRARWPRPGRSCAGS